MDLENRVALVTGSSRGIGKAIAVAMADAGADVAVHYRTSLETAEEVADAIRAKGRRALVTKADVRNEGEVTTMIDSVVRSLGQLDILVNNAGYGLDVPFLETSVSQWDDLFATLPRGYSLCSRAALPHLLRSKGVILNIASVTGIVGTSGEAAYSAANGAICALTRALSKEFGPSGVRVNGILVVWATTENNPIESDNPAHQKFLEELSLRRAASPEEIADTAVYLCNDRASSITGVLMPVDSGYL